MSKYYKLNNLPSGRNWGSEVVFGKFRGNQDYSKLEANFDLQVLYYLSERVINYLLDSISLEQADLRSPGRHFNDFSFFTAPAYKALEGFLFQIAKDLNLPSSGNSNLAGSYYFDEEKIDKHIDKLLKELFDVADAEKKLSKYEKRDIKDRIREMKGFLQHYRNTPSHFYGEPIDTIDKAHRNIMIIYGAIDNTTKILIKSGLIKIEDEIH
ncbi:MAG: hypothetical protein HYV53_03370 [Parcubacteria group bacterium]|nr:hypothetical protein [Parcubacteria group bacterium]